MQIFIRHAAKRCNFFYRDCEITVQRIVVYLFQVSRKHEKQRKYHLAGVFKDCVHILTPSALFCSSVLGHVSAFLHGASWWREDSHIKPPAEPLQSHQHDIPGGE